MQLLSGWPTRCWLVTLTSRFTYERISPDAEMVLIGGKPIGIVRKIGNDYIAGAQSFGARRRTAARWLANQAEKELGL